MTSITRDAVELHDLRSPRVIDKLKREEHLLIDQIASRPYAKILQVIDSEIPAIDNWGKRDEKLKWVLHTQVAALGRLYATEDIIGAVVAKVGTTKHSLKDLIYELYFLSLDLSSLFYELEYSTWNLIDFLDPDHYFGLRKTPSSFLEEFADTLHYELSTTPASLNNFCETLLEKGLDRSSIEAAKISLTEWMDWVQSYKRVILHLYEAQDLVETLYAFHYALSIATRLLGMTLSLSLLLKPLMNDTQELMN
jgi:hypothetical protein